MILTNDQTDKWLYYETGFEQLHPNPSIIDWMVERGYVYQTNWNCKRMVTRTGQNKYALMFPNEEIKTLFMLRWS